MWQNVSSAAVVIGALRVNRSIAWVKVFRIVPEFRVFRLTFHRVTIQIHHKNPKFRLIQVASLFQRSSRDSMIVSDSQ